MPRRDRCVVANPAENDMKRMILRQFGLAASAHVLEQSRPADTSSDAANAVSSAEFTARAHSTARRLKSMVGRVAVHTPGTTTVAGRCADQRSETLTSAGSAWQRPHSYRVLAVAKLTLRGQGGENSRHPPAAGLSLPGKRRRSKRRTNPQGRPEWGTSLPLPCRHYIIVLPIGGSTERGRSRLGRSNRPSAVAAAGNRGTEPKTLM